MFLFQTPLHSAAQYGKGDVVEILLRNGANINEKDVKNISVGETNR
jgi:ankyrin repeat protein